MLEGFRHVTRFRVAFADVDMLRHANNIAYLRWAETTRTEYFADVLGSEITSARGMILVRLAIDYERQLSYREAVAIGCRVSRIGTKSFDFTHEIWSDDAHERTAVVVNTVVANDYDLGRTIAFPDDWRARVLAYEPQTPHTAAGRQTAEANRTA